MAYFSVHFVDAFFLTNLMFSQPAQTICFWDYKSMSLHSCTTLDRGISYLQKQMEGAKVEARDIDEELRVSHL